MEVFKKVFIIMFVVLIFIICFCFGKYFHKYYVITKFQKTIDEIEETKNYEFILVNENCHIYLKDNIQVVKYDTYCDVVDWDKEMLINITADNYFSQKIVGHYIIDTIFSYFCIKDDGIETSFGQIKNDLKVSKLIKTEFNGKKCYKLNFITKGSKEGTYYFERGTYLPVAYSFEDDVHEVQVKAGTVTDDDVSVEKLKDEVGYVKKIVDENQYSDGYLECNITGDEKSEFDSMYLKFILDENGIVTEHQEKWNFKTEEEALQQYNNWHGLSDDNYIKYYNNVKIDSTTVSFSSNMYIGETVEELRNNYKNYELTYIKN